MGVNWIIWIIGNGPKSLGDIIDEAAGHVDMYERLY
jgi:hypothetical protein